MAVKTVDIALSEFEQGGFYVGNNSGNVEYSSTTEVRAQSVLISGIFDTGNIISITVLSVGNDWSFVGLTSTNSFVFISAALGYKTSGTVIDISSYNTVRKIRIELHRENGISPPQEAILRVVYEDGATWRMEGDYPVPIQALQATTEGFVKPYPASVLRIDESNGGYPYNELMPDILYNEPAQTLGAFQGVAFLAAVRVPITVKAIGSAAFAGTALQRVKIAADCAYEETSFPAGCVVEHYGDDRYEQLRDCEGRAILDCDARRIYVRKVENTNG